MNGIQSTVTIKQRWQEARRDPDLFQKRVSALAIKTIGTDSNYKLCPSILIKGKVCHFGKSCEKIHSLEFLYAMGEKFNRINFKTKICSQQRHAQLHSCDHVHHGELFRLIDNDGKTVKLIPYNRNKPIFIPRPTPSPEPEREGGSPSSEISEPEGVSEEIIPQRLFTMNMFISMNKELFSTATRGSQGDKPE